MARRATWQIGVGTTPAPFNPAPADSDVTAWAAAVTSNGGMVSSGRHALVSTMFGAWKAAGVYPLIDDAWLLVAENAVQALTSLKQRRLAAAINSPLFTIDRGYAFSGTGYIDTGFIPGTHGVALTGTSLHIAAYERTNVGATNVAAAGCVNSSSQNLVINPRSASNFMSVQANCQSIGPSGDTVTDSRGLSVGSRNGTLAADVLAYKNGVAVVPFTVGTLSSTRPTSKLYIGARSDASNVAGGFRASTLGFVSVGAAIPAGQQPAFYDAIQAYMTSTGANV
jgi:hypothetical protein